MLGVVEERVNPQSLTRSEKSSGKAALAGLLLAVAAAVYLVGFVHLRADFPSGSPWSDWSKMTDEGWYGSAAIRHFTEGHWYLPESFNPAVAMPVWPLMLGAWFKFAGVDMGAARALTMLLYGASLVMLYRLLRLAVPGRPHVAAAGVLLTALNPFCSAFDRLALLEPVTVFWMMLAFVLAEDLPEKAWLRQVALGLVLCALVLTKATGVALVPALLYLVWVGKDTQTSVGSPRRAWPALLVTGSAAAAWLTYIALAVRPHHLADYRLLFQINAYRVHLSIVPRMAWVTVRDGLWIQPVLFPLTLALLAASVVWLRSLWRRPLYVAGVLAVFGHLAYVGYHTNFQPRYYLVIAMPMMMILVPAAAALWERRHVAGRILGAALVVAAGMMAVQWWGFVTHPQYSFLSAAQGIAAVVASDGTGKPLLSDSGDDLTLLSGVRAIPLSYALHGMDALLDRYQPEWYAAWPGWEDPAIAAVQSRYRLDEVARYRIFDDPRRQVLVLYKLTRR